MLHQLHRTVIILPIYILGGLLISTSLFVNLLFVSIFKIMFLYINGISIFVKGKNIFVINRNTYFKITQIKFIVIF